MIGLCEMCGKETELIKSKIEGSILKVCKSCSKYGIIVEDWIGKEEITKTKPNKIITKEEPMEIVVEDYPQKIKQARERLNLKQKELAIKLAIKESIIHKLESGHLEPDITTAKKLEKFLNIKLIQIYVDDYKQKNKSTTSFTIGDLIK